MLNDIIVGFVMTAVIFEDIKPNTRQGPNIFVFETKIGRHLGEQ